MINTERTILAIAIQYPEHIETILANCDDGFFNWPENQKIFETIKDLHEGKSLTDWDTIIDLLKGEIQVSWFMAMQDTLRGTYPMGLEALLLAKIKLVKEERAKKEILSEIQRELQGHAPDFARILELAERGKVIRIIQEQADFPTAHNAYVEWKERRPTNITTGFQTFDNLTDNYDYGEIVTIMGRPVTGKTFCALNILERLLNQVTDKIGFFSLEMSKAGIMERMMQLFFGLSRWELKRKRLAKELDEEKFFEKYGDLNIYSRIYTVREIEKLVERDGLKIIFIDYLQLIREDYGRGLYEQTSAKMREIKELAKNKEVVVFLMSQISRKGEGGWTPVTIDMARDSGAIEENSDFIIGIWDPYLEKNVGQEWEGKIMLKLIKNKRGMIRVIECNRDRSSGKLYELEIERGGLIS